MITLRPNKNKDRHIDCSNVEKDFIPLFGECENRRLETMYKLLNVIRTEGEKTQRLVIKAAIVSISISTLLSSASTLMIIQSILRTH